MDECGKRVLRSSREGEKAGDHFRYASISGTMVLTKMVENIENKHGLKCLKTVCLVKVHARQSMEFNLTPDGMAIAVGLVSTAVEDMALCFLNTPKLESW
ncbi:hypothetical protein OH492_15555 [Vibrio chagasii]|nr:hypothetical protein [Vibrio chagasii]